MCEAQERRRWWRVERQAAIARTVGRIEPKSVVKQSRESWHQKTTIQNNRLPESFHILATFAFQAQN